MGLKNGESGWLGRTLRPGIASRSTGIAFVASCAVLAGCATSHSTADSCGDESTYVRTPTAAYCIGVVVRGGFECPAELPVMLEVGDQIVCSSEPTELGDLPTEVCTMLDDCLVDRDGGTRPDEGVIVEENWPRVPIVVAASIPEVPADLEEDLRQAVLLAVDEVNGAGGLTPLALPHEASADQYARVEIEFLFEQVGAEELLFDANAAGAAALVGPFNADTAVQAVVALQSAEDSAKLPLMSVFGGASPRWGIDQDAGLWGFSDYMSDVPWAMEAAFRVAKERHGCSMAAVLHYDSGVAAEDAWVLAMIEEAAQNVGVSIDDVSTDTAACQTAFGTPPEIIACLSEFVIPPECVVMDSGFAPYYARDIRPEYEDVPVVLVGAVVPPLWQGIAPSLLLLNGAPVVQLSRIVPARMQQLVQSWVAAGGSPPLESDAYLFAREYDYTAMILLAIEAAGSTEAAAIRDAIQRVGRDDGEVEVTPGNLAVGLQALREGKTINYQGAGGNMDFRDGPWAYPGEGTECQLVVDADAFELQSISCE